MERDDNDVPICVNCFNDELLQNVVRKRGSREVCAVCARTAKALSSRQYAHLIQPIIESHFECALPEYSMGRIVSPSGMTNVELVARITKCDDDKAAELLLSSLREVWWWDPRDGGEDPLDDDLRYRLNPLRDYSSTGWDAVEKSLRTRSRYFNPAVEEWLHDLFAGIDKVASTSGQSVIRLIGPSTEPMKLWRVRLAADRNQAELFVTNPEQELGPPPSRYATSGRMNASGISVFYGAEDIATCIAEVRAPAGSFAVASPFEIVRDLRLLDLPALLDAQAETLSHFDPDFVKKHQRAALLRDLSYRLQQPTLPSEESTRYLPTQMVAEYLGTRCSPAFDGVVYASTQAGGSTRNFVLFQHASTLVPLPVGQRRDVSAQTDWETGQLQLKASYEPATIEDAFDFLDKSLEEVPCLSEPAPEQPTLRLLCSEMQLIRIEAVSHSFSQDGISWKESAAPSPEPRTAHNSSNQLF